MPYIRDDMRSEIMKNRLEDDMAIKELINSFKERHPIDENTDMSKQAVVHASTWTGRKPKRHFPRFEFMISTSRFGLRIGQLQISQWVFVYGLHLAFGKGGQGCAAYTQKWNKRWVWLTAEQVYNG